MTFYDRMNAESGVTSLMQYCKKETSIVDTVLTVYISVILHSNSRFLFEVRASPL